MPMHLQSEIQKLNQKFLKLTSLIEKAVLDAINSIENLDYDLANQTIELDNEIDDLEVEIEEDCLKILALYQPVANDLRFIVGVLKMNNDLERIGDLASNIAFRAKSLCRKGPHKSFVEFDEICSKVIAMVHDSIGVLIEMNIEKAKKILDRDHEIDELNRNIHKLFIKAVEEKPELTSTYLQYLSASKNLERVGDITTNIAEDVIYMVTGKIIRHHKNYIED